MYSTPLSPLSPSSSSRDTDISSSSTVLPSVEDRKRFLSCLAVVLSSCYDYDVVDTGAFEGVNNFVFSLDDDDDDVGEEDDDDNSDNDFEAVPGAIKRTSTTTSSGRTTTGSGSVASSEKSEEDKLVEQATLMAKQAENSIRKQQRIKNKNAIYKSSDRDYQKSIERHRKRRYGVASNLLWKVADYLYLENAKMSEIQKLRPIIEVLLLPPSKRAAAKLAATSTSAMTASPLFDKKSPMTITTITTTKEATTSYSQTVRKAIMQRVKSSSSSGDGGDEDEPSSTTPKKKKKDSSRHGGRGDSTSDMSSSWTLQQDELITSDENSELLGNKLRYMTPGSGYQCLILVLFQYLLNSEEGYDTRVRFAMKKLFTIFYLHNNNNNKNGASGEDDKLSYDNKIALATRKFENLEHVLADRILTLAKENHHQGNANSRNGGGDIGSHQITRVKKATSRKQQLLKGLKIGTAGVVAGTLLVVTGGMAAPGIAAGLGALHLAAVGTTVLLLAGSHAAVSIFGVAGGSLAMYKMNRRNAGLSEFIFQQVLDDDEQDEDDVAGDGKPRSTSSESELSRTICVSGWLNDACDFQRPWGVAPTDPRISNKLELLQRFYLIHNPELAPYSEYILKCWKGSETKLWQLLLEKYHVDPDHLFPLLKGPRFQFSLNRTEVDLLDQIIVEVGTIIKKRKEAKKSSYQPASAPRAATSSFSTGNDQLTSPVGGRGGLLGFGLIKGWGADRSEKTTRARTSLSSGLGSKSSSTPRSSSFGARASRPSQSPSMTEIEKRYSLNQYNSATTNNSVDYSNNRASSTSNGGEADTSSQATGSLAIPTKESADKVWDTTNTEFPPPSAAPFEQVPVANANIGGNSDKRPKHVVTTWDFRANFGGELYTLKWESKLLIKLCNSLSELALEWTGYGTRTALKLSVASTLIMAAAIPTYICDTINQIDHTWTLVISRSEKVGKELARSLLSNRAGRRPVTLIGYSFGARAIYSCLKELAKYQEQWEEHQERLLEQRADRSRSSYASATDRTWKTMPASSKTGGGTLHFECEPACVVEDVILMGTPAHLKLSIWRSIRRVVAGRLINVYSRNDRMLSYMFKYRQMTGGLRAVCGTCTVAVPGVENFDATDIILGHSDYCYAAGEILQRVRLGQPIRNLSNVAIDEEAIIDEAEQMTNQMGKEEETTEEKETGDII